MPVNVELKVRQIIATIAGLAGVDGIYSDSTLESLGFDEDSHLVFWREIEHEFDFGRVTRVQREQLRSVGAIVTYVNQRRRATA